LNRSFEIGKERIKEEKENIMKKEKRKRQPRPFSSYLGPV
jgi:hypothetical protein